MTRLKLLGSDAAMLLKENSISVFQYFNISYHSIIGKQYILCVHQIWKMKSNANAAVSYGIRSTQQSLSFSRPVYMLWFDFATCWRPHLQIKLHEQPNLPRQAALALEVEDLDASSQAWDMPILANLMSTHTASNPKSSLMTCQCGSFREYSPR